MSSTTGSKAFRLDATDLQKIGNSAMLAIAGVAVGALMLLQQRIDAQADPNSLMAVLAATLTPAIINAIRKWASDNSSRPTLPAVDLDASALPQTSVLTPELAARVIQVLDREMTRERAAATARSDPPPIP